MQEQKSILSASAQDKTGSLASFKLLLRRLIIFDDNLLPARVIQFDREKNLATVRPMIMWVDSNDGSRQRPQIDNVPVISLGAGGFHISFPINNGDLGWILASDRDISKFKDSLKESKPNSGRLHSFEDCMFIPDVFRQYVISGEDSGAMVIQSTDSASRISIRGDNIKITTPVKVVLDTPDVEMTNNLKVNGNFQVIGNSTLKNTSVNGIDLTSHGHIETNVGRTAGGMVS